MNRFHLLENSVFRYQNPVGTITRVRPISVCNLGTQPNFDASGLRKAAAIGLVCLFFVVLLASLAFVQTAHLRILIGDGDNASVWARLEVRDTAGKMYQPPESAQVILDRTSFRGTNTYYNGHF